jgi:hypothetical protein
MVAIVFARQSSRPVPGYFLPVEKRLQTLWPQTISLLP